MNRGADISSYQGMPDFDALVGIDFLFMKATEGSGFVDPQFARNWSEAKRVGLRRGAYHFADPDLGSSAQDEARHFLSILGPLDATDMLGLDYERDWSGDVVGWCKTWLDLVRSVTGITPYIYLNLHLSHVYDWGVIEQPGGYPLWLADYDGLQETPIATPWPNVAIKQWTSSGSLTGINGLVDLNTAFGGSEVDEATVTAIIKAYLATTYGPALEAELTQRIPTVDTIAAAVEARIAAKLAAQ